MTRRELFLRRAPFAFVAIAGQLTAIWPPGPSNMGLFWASSVLLLASVVLVLRSHGLPPRIWLVRSVLYIASVSLLLLATGGLDSGLGVLLLVPVVGVALYGEAWESAFTVVAALIAMLVVSLVSGPHIAGATFRRLLLSGSLAAMLTIGIHTIRNRLLEANERAMRLLGQAKDVNVAARELTLLSDPPAITALGAELAGRIAMPEGSEALRASYLRIQDGIVMIDAQSDQSGSHLEGSWALEEHPAIAQAVATLRPVSARLDPERVGPVVRDFVAATGVTHGVWMPVCPDGELHGVLAVASRGTPVPEECVDRVVALGHFLELALSNWTAHEKLKHRATAEERRRIARELHDGLAHELAFIASKTRGWDGHRPKTLDMRELSGAADRALDEARRAITVLSVPQPQSLGDAIAQTAEDLGLRLGVAIHLDLGDDADVPGEVTENLLRIVREAVTNAAMHGQASRVTVRLDQTDVVRLIIEDDGRGFDPDAVTGSSGFGLLSMQERAASVGATFRVESAPQHGTIVEVAFQ
jgi:signal transduction histidine kinase